MMWPQTDFTPVHDAVAPIEEILRDIRKLLNHLAKLIDDKN
jgi:hypothetical protein